MTFVVQCAVMAATSSRAGSRSSPHKSAAEGQAVQIALCGAHSGGIIVIGLKPLADQNDAR